ncbi:uracil-DNA glycosylase family protein [Burkholderia sp. ABCPW 111]|uniref:uracil-DNA glycosylase family protein n=1 Tax=Burkholderia sp. ABCPW 111 TaxID=1820025 RepID=UPI0005312F3E|nr:uracil-DNA glycosylase family protein [Burkholderia sp. ABCPW 111]KGS04870.1 uracil-DNA glycosylase, 4 family protein [Burkholderia sp. ABCPW 111]
MALAEAALEELGLAPAWVRRGIARAEGAQQDVAGAARETAGAAAAEGARAVSPDAAREPARRIARVSATEGEGVRGGAESAAVAANEAAHATERAEDAESIEPAAIAHGRATHAPRAADVRAQARRTAAESGMPAANAPSGTRARDVQGEQGSTIASAAPSAEPPVAGGERRVAKSDGAADAAAFARAAGASRDAADPARASTAPAARTGDDVDAAGPDDDMSWFDLEPVLEPALPDAVAAAAGPAVAATSVAELGWDALRARVADCQRCRLCEKRTNTVFGVGDESADWMLVGEAPGENEDKQGEPFVGQAGKLLDNMLRALELKRGENVYIANVIKCRPPGNRNPEPDEVARCEPYLQRQVALVKPRLIVALGRFAAQTLLKTDASIASMRGRVHQYEGVPVIVTYHPAYLLRSLQDKAKAWSDLCLAHDTYRNAAPAADPQ